MGLLKKLFAGKSIEVDPADLRLPEEVPTYTPGLNLRKSQGSHSVGIDIVGESFRAANVAAVAAAAAGGEFDIYLINEPTNQYDKKAVAVYAANLHLGYIAKPANKQWFKWVEEALQRKELLWGPARAVSRDGTQNIGIFGSILMPATGATIDDLQPTRLDDPYLAKAIQKVITLAASGDEPETLAQMRSLCKRAVAVATPLAAHAMWVQQNPDGQNVDAWADILDACDEIFSNASTAVYATDESEVDVFSSVEELSDLLRDILDASPPLA